MKSILILAIVSRGKLAKNQAKKVKNKTDFFLKIHLLTWNSSKPFLEMSCFFKSVSTKLHFSDFQIFIFQTWFNMSLMHDSEQMLVV